MAFVALCEVGSFLVIYTLFGTSKPFIAKNSFVLYLFMHNALAKTDEPLYGKPSISNVPCTDPFSPCPPCNAINTKSAILGKSDHFIFCEFCNKSTISLVELRTNCDCVSLYNSKVSLKKIAIASYFCGDSL